MKFNCYAVAYFAKYFNEEGIFYLLAKSWWVKILTGLPIRGKVSREFHIYSHGMLDLAYIGATHLNFDQYQALFILKDK